MKAFARFKNELWSTNLAYVDNIAQAKEDVKFLLVRRNLFVRTVDAVVEKTKNSTENLRAF